MRCGFARRAINRCAIVPGRRIGTELLSHTSVKRKNDPHIDEALQEAAKRNAEAISGSAVFVVMFNETMIDEVIPLIQMGLAVYMDKPVYILVPESKVLQIPENVRRIARGLEVYKDDDLDSLKDATLRLMDGAGIAKEDR